MGSVSKTVITLTAINELRYNRFAITHTLVIAPKRVAEGTWSREAAKWAHLSHLRVQPVLGGATAREAALRAQADIHVINRENVQWLVEHYKGKWPFDCVVVDELSSFKNPKAKRFRALCTVLPKINRLIGLTGTPAPNGLLDLWSQVYLLDRGQRLYKRMTHYRERYFTPDKRSQQIVWSWKLKQGSEEAIHAKIADICMSMRSQDYLDLPELVIVDEPVALDKPAQELYCRMEKELLLQINGKDIDAGTAAVYSGSAAKSSPIIIDAGTAAVLTNKLLQLGNGNIYDEDGTAHHLHTCKLDALTELIEALNGQHAIVFYGFRSDLPMLQTAAGKLRWRKLENDQDVQDWNAGKVDLLFAHPASCAHGLNLQDGGSHAVFFSLPWSLELYEQAVARLHRQGQKERVIIHRLLVQGGVDEDVALALEGKTTLQDALMERLKR